MPAPLPTTSGYTYAVELSADQAIAAGAASVTFSAPVPFYVENFLDFPVGGVVPAGYYDRLAGAWVASDNGRIVKILSIDGSGRAQLDVDGDASADTATALAALGITDDERQALATTYAAGQSLWRVPIPHFTPWDCNWPYAPPNDARQPDVPPVREERATDTADTDKACRSVIECQNQILGEVLPLTVTALSLTYQSDRAPGYTASNSLIAPLSGAAVPASLKRIDMTSVLLAMNSRRVTHRWQISR